MWQDVISALVLAAIYLLFALGMSLAWGTIGILNFAHGAIFMFSAFLGYLLVRDVRLPMLALIPIGMAAGAVLSLLVQFLAFEPILRFAKDPTSAELQILIGGIGVAAIPLAIAQRVTNNFPFGYSKGSFALHTYHFSGLRISNAQIVIISAGIVLGGGLAWWLHTSRSGLALRSIGVDSETASMMGIDRRTLGAATMAIAGALAGLAGILLTYDLGAIDPSTGDSLLLKGFAAIILGGVGSMTGVMVGSLVLASAETVVLTQTSGSWVDAVSFGLIFVVLLVRPQGIFGRKVVQRT